MIITTAHCPPQVVNLISNEDSIVSNLCDNDQIYFKLEAKQFCLND